MMKKVAVAIAAAGVLCACSNSSLPGTPVAPAAAITTEQAESSLCGHILDRVLPLADSSGVPFDKAAANAWGSISDLLVEDATLYERAGGHMIALKVRGLAQAADSMKAAIDQLGDSNADLVSGSDAIALATQGGVRHDAGPRRCLGTWSVWNG